MMFIDKYSYFYLFLLIIDKQAFIIVIKKQNIIFKNQIFNYLLQILNIYTS